MKNKKLKYGMLCVLTLLVLWLGQVHISHALDPATLLPAIELILEFGPKLLQGDGPNIANCVAENFSNTFPWDFWGEFTISPTAGCPNVTLFNHTPDLCWITELITEANPIILLSMFYGAILKL